MAEKKEQILSIKIVHQGVDDGLSAQLTASPNLALGMIARARFELDVMEKGVFTELSKKKEG